MGVIAGARGAEAALQVRIHTDSKYVMDGATKWIHGWKKNGWRTADKKPVKNVELWQRLDAASAPHKVDWTWVKGHSGQPRTNAPTRWREARSRSCGLSIDKSAALPLGRHRPLLGRLFVDQVELLLRAVAGIVAFGQAPDLRLAGAAEVQQAAHLARRAVLHLGDAERDLAPDLHVVGGDALDHAVDRAQSPSVPGATLSTGP